MSRDAHHLGDLLQRTPTTFAASATGEGNCFAENAGITRLFCCQP